MLSTTSDPHIALESANNSKDLEEMVAHFNSLEPAPDFVVLVHRPAGELGVGPFGRDPRFGSRLVDWVEAHYRRVQRFGAEPFTGQGFGTVVLERSLR